VSGFARLDDTWVNIYTAGLAQTKTCAEKLRKMVAEGAEGYLSDN
jgi:hypothetical protein